MGSHYYSRRFPVSSENELFERFAEFKEDQIFEYGHGRYTGDLKHHGLKVIKEIFTDASKADDYICENTDKYGPAYAIKVGDFNKAYPQTAKEKATVEKFNEIQKVIKNFEKDLIDRVKTSKSAFRGCKKCESKIAVKFVSLIDCPVCHSHDFIYTETDKNKLKALMEKSKELQKTINEQKEKYKNVNAFWLVGGWSPS